MRFWKDGRYRRSEVEGAPHYSNNFVRCGVEVGVEVICRSVGVEVMSLDFSKWIPILKTYSR